VLRPVILDLGCEPRDLSLKKVLVVAPPRNPATAFGGSFLARLFAPVVEFNREPRCLTTQILKFFAGHGA